MEKEIASNPKKQIPYATVLIIWAAITCVTANLLTLVLQFGGFEIWKTLDKPPAGAAHIVEADGGNVWVEARDGNMYSLTLYCFDREDCRQWLAVDDPAKINPWQCHPTKRGPTCENLGGYFSPGNPFTGQVTECIVADGCFPDPEYGSETYFALLSDGTVKYWEHGNGSLGFIFFFILSTIVLPVLAAIIVSIVYSIRIIARKIRKTG